VNEIKEILSIRGTFLRIIVGLVLVNCSVLGDHVLWPIWRWGLLLSFYLRGGFGCEKVLLEVAPLNKIFEVHVKRPVLRGSVSLVVMEGVVVFCFGTSKIVWLCFQKLHPGLNLDGFEDVLDRALQRSETIIHLVGSEWTLLRVRG